MMYDYASAIVALDQNWKTILPCLIAPVVFTYIYFSSAVRQARTEKVYVETFFAAAFFFWHDLSFVLDYKLWFGGAYDHWWFKGWWYALLGTVAFEGYLIYQVYHYGHRELWPNLSRGQFGALLIAGTLAIGSLWFALKNGLNDDLFFLSFTATAVIPSAPMHTALMVMRKSRAGQSVVRQLCMTGNIVFVTLAFAQVSDFFLSPLFLSFAFAFALWPLANIALIRSLPATAPADAQRSGASAS